MSKPTSPVIMRFECCERAESDWQECSYERYIYCDASYEHDARIIVNTGDHDKELLNQFAAYLSERCDLNVANMVRPFLEKKNEQH